MADFDHIANRYDTDFTQTAIGKAQRQLVHHQLEKLQLDFNQVRVLEINCGTGQDALYFAKKGAQVLATDISYEMVSVTQKKTLEFPNVSSEVLDINQLSTFHSDEKYDVIFSNFGGLNCLTTLQLQTFLEVASTRLEKNGQLIMVIMPEFCGWETLYFLSKFNWKKAFRRKNKSGVLAKLDGKEVKTYYYSPLNVIKLASKFKMKWISPIGLFVPPSYLNKLFLNGVNLSQCKVMSSIQ